ncbi:unconventional myosin-XIX isoform X1 [Nomia melanderi]|uniref:unconventional myosin-XIX isoform X1 n=2 Tax=Nomia melanderi TaxID=2448451 RepID=UPI003FCDC530
MATTMKPVSPIGWDLLNDLSAIPEESIVDFLLDRLQQGQIYTWVGPLLLTLNPKNEVSTSNLYNFSEFYKRTNMSGNMYESNPHIFSVAIKAHYNLTQKFGRNCQVIIISGETGTGKTFNAVKCLELFSRMNKHLVSACEGDHVQNIMSKIMDACRLVSAFTTASTERNDVSSRHGQLIRLHYETGAISGATINSLLLERSRVTRSSSNFQIFYQMMFGMSSVELQSFNLSKYKSYVILNAIDYNKKKIFQEGFEDTWKAMDVLGFKEDQKNHIFQVLALLIHMGNIKFVKNGDACVIDLDDQESKEALESTCKLSCLTDGMVAELLTTILINPKSSWRKHTTYHRYLVTVDACRVRLCSIIRHLYDLLFYWILNHTNNALSVKHECSEWLGILDIFGFESVNKNGIEQLCVNYANERMQQYFMETYLESSRKYLQEEGFIESNEPLHTINVYKERLTILEETLFLTLNDVSQSPIVMDIPTITQLVYTKLYSKQNKFLSIKEGNFIVRHYSYPVAYSIEDLLSKNTDKVPDEMSIIFHTSKNKFLRSLIDIEKKPHLQIARTPTKKKTMLTKLKCNIDVLLKELSKCDLHYVRCIKPSRLNDHEWDKNDLRKQLADIGVFDALSIAKYKYPIRLSYKDFYQRYSKHPKGTVHMDKCKTILEAVVPKQELHTMVHYGTQFIFLTEALFFKLEVHRKNYRKNYANKIQEFWIKHKRKKMSIVPVTAEQKQDEKANQNNPNTELEKSSSSEDDNVFISSPESDNITKVERERNNLHAKEKVVQNLTESSLFNSNATKVKKEKIKLNVKEKLLDDYSKKNTLLNRGAIASKKGHDFGSVQKKNSFTFVHTVKSKLKKFIKKIVPSQLSKSEHHTVYKSHIEFQIADGNNNLMEQFFEDKMSSNSFTNTRLIKNNDKQVHCLPVDTGKNTCTIQKGNYTLFHGNGILSRRRLSEVPVKIYIRPTCTSNLYSVHFLSHTKLPQGLQNCL